MNKKYIKWYLKGYTLTAKTWKQLQEDTLPEKC